MQSDLRYTLLNKDIFSYKKINVLEIARSVLSYYFFHKPQILHSSKHKEVADDNFIFDEIDGNFS